MSDFPAITFDGASARLTLDLRTYRLSAVKKAAYRLAGRFTAFLGSPEGETLPITLSFKPGTSEPVALETVRVFLEELLDQELREHIGEEIGPMRTLILAHAFSKTDLIRHE